MTNQNQQRGRLDSGTALAPARIGLPNGPQTDVEVIADALITARKTCNVLGPMMRLEYLPQDHHLDFVVVHFPLEGLEITKRDQGLWIQRGEANGLWYALDGGKVALTKVALDQLAQAAAITWVFDKCQRTDDRSEPYVWSYRMTCRIKGLDGRLREISRSHDLDLRDGSPAAKKAGSPRNLQNTRINGAQLCESKAGNRVVRAALGIGSYTVEEANLPFVFPVLRWVAPDTPEMRLLTAAAELGLSREVFGGLFSAASPVIEAERVIDEEPQRQQIKGPQDDSSAGPDDDEGAPWNNR